MHELTWVCLIWGLGGTYLVSLQSPLYLQGKSSASDPPHGSSQAISSYFGLHLGQKVQVKGGCKLTYDKDKVLVVLVILFFAFADQQKQFERTMIFEQPSPLQCVQPFIFLWRLQGRRKSLCNGVTVC